MIKTTIAATAFLLLAAGSTQAQVSLEAGAGREVQYGSFIAPCGCTFLSGTGLGIVANVGEDLFSTQGLTIGTNAGVNYQKFTTYERPSVKDSSDVADIGLLYLTIEPNAKYHIPGTSFIVGLGANAGFLVSNSYKHTTRPIPDPEEDVDSSQGDLNAFRIAARASVGYTIPLGLMELVPTFSFQYPLNTIREKDADNWKLLSYYGSVVLRFKL